jgi:hypothetical protein
MLAGMLTGFPKSGAIYGPPAPVPAAAHSVPGIGPTGVGREVDQIRSDIRHGRDSGQLSRKQAKELRREAGEIQGLQERYSSNGLTDFEQSELLNRTEVLRAITNAKRSGIIK